MYRLVITEEYLNGNAQLKKYYKTYTELKKAFDESTKDHVSSVKRLYERNNKKYIPYSFAKVVDSVIHSKEKDFPMYTATSITNPELVNGLIKTVWKMEIFERDNSMNNLDMELAIYDQK